MLKSRNFSIDHVISTAPNGANLVIDRSLAEEAFTNFGIDDSKIVVVYGEYLNPSAARITWTLMYHGHTNVKILKIGLSEWQKSGLPVTRQISTQRKQLNKNVYFKSKINPMISGEKIINRFHFLYFCVVEQLQVLGWRSQNNS